jgi:hypothetical protein
MNGVKFIRGSGGLARRLAGEDHVSGLIYALGKDTPLGGKHSLRSAEEAEAAGITAAAAPLLHYHISEFFRLAPGATLFAMVVAEDSLDGTFTEIKELQQYAGGRLRRVGIPQPGVALADVTAQAGTVNAVCTELAAQNMPLTAVMGGHVASGGLALLADLHTKSCPRVGICLAQDGAGYGAWLQKQDAGKSVGAVGALLGALAKRRVSDSIGWVERYSAVSAAYPKSLTGGEQQATELDVPALCDGTLISDLTPLQLEAVNEKGYILLFKRVGYSGTYWNDAFAAAALTSDYAYLENSEVMDKACRGVYQALLPSVSGPAYVDASTGYLAESTCKSLEAIAATPLEQMERDGELSGYAVSIDPEQPVLSTSKLNVVIKLVPVGVLREITVTIGFTLKTAE